MSNNGSSPWGLRINFEQMDDSLKLDNLLLLLTHLVKDALRQIEWRKHIQIHSAQFERLIAESDSERRFRDS